jgi:DNA-binding winged helix-turn-helix (wHTH) protein
LITIHQEIVFPLTQISKKGERLLPLKARCLLCHLIDHQGDVCPRDQLIKTCWPTEYAQGIALYDQALNRQIDRLRSWLRENGDLNRYVEIENSFGVGYQLVIKH